jgi:hypothetical protein
MTPVGAPTAPLGGRTREGQVVPRIGRFTISWGSRLRDGQRHSHEGILRGVERDFTSRRYVLVCVVTDQIGGKRHRRFEDGLTRVFTVP